MAFSYYGYILRNDRDIAHYGVLGMKWGIRRYQNADGTLTAEGKKRARAEYKADNKEAFETGKNATIADRAYRVAQRKSQRAAKRYDKKPSERNQRKLEMRKELEEKWRQEAKRWSDRAEKHCDELISKYGKDAVAKVAYDKKGRISEDVHSVGEYVADMLVSVGSMSLMMAGITPIGIVSAPKPAASLGVEAYDMSVREYRANHRK